MSTSLWTDLEALERLARSERKAANRSGAGGRWTPPASGPFPPFPEREGMVVRAIDMPARLVTGDYCDFFPVEDDTLALVMADVSGKGAPAALLRGVTRSVLRNISSDSRSPGETLTRLNRILYEARLGPMFLTVFLAWYDLPTGALRYANAGHPVPYRVTPDGEVTPLGEVTGPLLGILDLDRYDERADRLEPGDRLVLFTDGVTEARNPRGEFLGPAGLVEILSAGALSDAAGLCEAVRRAVDEFQAGLRQDDATILILHRTT